MRKGSRLITIQVFRIGTMEARIEMVLECPSTVTGGPNSGLWVKRSARFSFGISARCTSVPRIASSFSGTTSDTAEDLSEELVAKPGSRLRRGNFTKRKHYCQESS